MKNELNRIKLFIRNVRLILAVDLPHKIIFSFSCALFSLFSAEAMYYVFSRVLVNLEGIQYIDKSNVIQVCTHPVTLILILLFLIIMTNTALFEIGGLLHAFSMAQIGRKTDIWSMIAAGERTPAGRRCGDEVFSVSLISLFSLISGSFLSLSFRFDNNRLKT